MEKQAPTGPCPNCARFEAEAKESEKKATDNENFYKRIAADFENYRRRNDREREEAVGLGIQKAVESILPALDDLDRAKNSLATVTDTKAVIDSLNLVFARFAKCLDPLGVKTMEVLGEHFDPKFHEPVQEIPTTYYPDGAVAQELRRGYMIRDKVIRPALVNVASNESGVVTPMPAAAPVEAAAAAPAPAPAATEPAQAATEPAPAPASDEPVAEVVNHEPQVKGAEGGEPADDNGVVLSETMSPENQKAVADQAATKQRAANALERLRKPNPTATAELPAYQPEPLERVTEDPMEPLPKINPDSDSEVFVLDEDEAKSDASSKGD